MKRKPYGRERESGNWKLESGKWKVEEEEKE
jgi:hypothetical protein